MERVESAGDGCADHRRHPGVGGAGAADGAIAGVGLAIIALANHADM